MTTPLLFVLVLVSVPPIVRVVPPLLTLRPPLSTTRFPVTVVVPPGSCMDKTALASLMSISATVTGAVMATV